MLYMYPPLVCSVRSYILKTMRPFSNAEIDMPSEVLGVTLARVYVKL
jgi:hypothetical protein